MGEEIAEKEWYHDAWIEKRFAAYTCTKMIKQANNPTLCKCGLAIARHIPGAALSNNPLEECTQDNFRADRTNCYGYIKFAPPANAVTPDSEILPPDHTDARFVRLSANASEENAENAADLLISHWDLDPPRMLFSITGGATSFNLPPMLDCMLSQGIARAAECGSVWLVTGGTNAGVMKYVAACARGTSGVSPCPIIGIAPWAILTDSVLSGLQVQGGVAMLGDPDDTTTDPTHLNRRLDRNHTHFLLADEGKYGDKGFGTEIRLRAAVERAVLKRKSYGEFGSVSAVAGLVIAIQGGMGTFKTVIEALEVGTPALIVDGSGLASNVIAYATRLFRHEKGYTEEGLNQLVGDYFVREQEEAALDWAHRCEEYLDRIYIYDVDFFGAKSKSTPFEVAILNALLDFDAKRALNRRSLLTTPKERQLHQNLDRIRKLEFALLWNRVDVAKAETSTFRLLSEAEINLLCGRKEKLPSTSVEIEAHTSTTMAKLAMLKYAIKNDNIEFVKLFLDVMKESQIFDLLTVKVDKLKDIHTDMDMCGATVGATPMQTRRFASHSSPEEFSAASNTTTTTTNNNNTNNTNALPSKASRYSPATDAMATNPLHIITETALDHNFSNPLKPISDRPTRTISTDSDHMNDDATQAQQQQQQLPPLQTPYGHRINHGQYTRQPLPPVLSPVHSPVPLSLQAAGVIAGTNMNAWSGNVSPCVLPGNARLMNRKKLRFAVGAIGLREQQEQMIMQNDLMQQNLMMQSLAIQQQQQQQQQQQLQLHDLNARGISPNSMQAIPSALLPTSSSSITTTPATSMEPQFVMVPKVVTQLIATPDGFREVPVTMYEYVPIDAGAGAGVGTGVGAGAGAGAGVGELPGQVKTDSSDTFANLAGAGAGAGAGVGAGRTNSNPIYYSREAQLSSPLRSQSAILQSDMSAKTILDATNDITDSHCRRARLQMILHATLPKHCRITVPRKARRLIHIPLPWDVDAVAFPSYIRLTDLHRLAELFLEPWPEPGMFHPFSPRTENQSEKIEYAKEVVQYIIRLLGLFEFSFSQLPLDVDASQRCQPDAVQLNKLYRLITINAFHKVQHKRGEQDSVPRHWDTCSDIQRNIFLNAVSNFFELCALKRYYIWKPNFLEDMFMITCNKTSAEHVHSTIEGGYLALPRIANAVTSLVVYDYSIKDVLTSTTYSSGCSPFFKLLIWAAVCGQLNLLDYFWRKDPKNAVVTAVVVAAICHRYTENNDVKFPEVMTNFGEAATLYSERALELVKLIEDADSAVADLLMSQQTYQSGGLPFWRLCFRCHNGAILASAPAQRVIRAEWMGGVTSKSSLKLIFAHLCFFYLILYFPRSIKGPGAGFTRSKFRKFFNSLIWDVGLHMKADEIGDTVAKAVVQGTSHAPVKVNQTSNVQSFWTLYWKVVKARITGFYGSPTVSYWSEVIGWLTFVTLFSVITVAPLETPNEFNSQFGNPMGNVRIVVYAWLIQLVFDEAMQIYAQRLKYFTYVWNVWNLGTFLMILSAIVLSYNGTYADHLNARPIFAASALLLWLRVGRLYATSPILGPKLVMIQLMMKDIFVFFAFWAIVLVGYGVALYSQLYLSRPLDYDTVPNILFWPYFQVFGETHLEDIRDMSGCLGDQFTSCPSQGYFSVVLLGLYIVVGNVLLVNLLIAMMSSTFENVNVDSQKIWALQNVELLEEIRWRFRLLGPLNIISHIYYLYNWVIRGGKVSPAHPMSKPDKRVGNLVIDALNKSMAPEATARDLEYLKKSVDSLKSTMDSMTDIIKSMQEAQAQSRTLY